MKREAFTALAASMMIVPAATAFAQSTGQGGAPVAQPSPPAPAAVPAQGNDDSSKSTAVAKQKTCEPVLIRAGPNQGQLVSKCRHRDKDAAHTPG